MATISIPFRQVRGSSVRVEMPECFEEFERRGVDLGQPFLMRVDTMLGIIDITQPVESD